MAAAVAAIAAYAVLAFGGAPAAFAAGCTRIAATNGSDSAAGTQAQPFRSAQKLVDSLTARVRPVACVSGTYSGNVKVTRSGASGAPITLTSYPGERATVAGKLWITESANFVTVSSLDLDGRNAGNLASPAINGDDVTFVDNDVTNYNTTICFSVGATTYGRAYRTVIQGNRIHNCGELPATNLDHGIYVEHSTGARIVDNVIYDNADRGVQLYPDAQCELRRAQHDRRQRRGRADRRRQRGLRRPGLERQRHRAERDHELDPALQRRVALGIADSSASATSCARTASSAERVDGDQHGLVAATTASPPPTTCWPTRSTSTAPARTSPSAPAAPARNLASYRAPAVAGVNIVLTAPSSARPGTTVPLRGRVTGAEAPPPHSPALTAQGKRWKTVKTVRVDRNGTLQAAHASAQVERSGRNHGRKLALQSVRLANQRACSTLQAVARGVGSSNTVKVRVRASGLQCAA